MLMVKTCLLKKQGASVTHWRQVTLLMASDTEIMEIKTYYGRSIKSLKEGDVFRYDLAGQAHRDFENIINYRTDTGYEYIELLCVPDEGLRLAAYTPPKYPFIQGDVLSNKLSNLRDMVALPIKFGQRAILKIGCESITSISAISAVDGKNIAINSTLSQAIIDNVKIGRFENGIFEVFIGEKEISFIDVAFVNGTPLSGGYAKRNKFIRGIFRQCDLITTVNYIVGDKSIIDLNNPNRDLDARAYIFKPAYSGFSPSGKVDDECFIAANFFRAYATVNNILGNKTHYDIHCTKSYKSVFIGHASPPTNKLHPIGVAVVNFTGMENGILINAWLSPYSESVQVDGCFTQFDNMKALWQGCTVCLDEKKPQSDAG